jgi:hypothetical protein
MEMGEPKRAFSLNSCSGMLLAETREGSQYESIALQDRFVKVHVSMTLHLEQKNVFKKTRLTEATVMDH